MVPSLQKILNSGKGFIVKLDELSVSIILELRREDFFRLRMLFVDFLKQRRNNDLVLSLDEKGEDFVWLIGQCKVLEKIIQDLLLQNVPVDLIGFYDSIAGEREESLPEEEDLTPFEFQSILSDGRQLPIFTKEIKRKLLARFPEIKQQYDQQCFGVWKDRQQEEGAFWDWLMEEQ